MYYYSVYNLVIQSELILPHVLAIPAQVKHQVNIQYGKVKVNGLTHVLSQGFNYQISPTEYWLSIPAIGRFLITDGQQIIIDPAADIDEDSLRVFLLSICLEILLKQRQLLIFPGYAIKRQQYAIAFEGTGPGLSLLQALFYKRGYSFLAGNFFALNHQQEILPGIAQIELWPAVMTRLQLLTTDLKTIRPGIEKYIIPLNHQYHGSALPLQLIYSLKMHRQSDITFSTVTGDLQRVNINLPASRLQLETLVDAIENDLVQRGCDYALI